MFDLSEIFLTSIRKDSMPPSKMSISAAVLSLSVPPGEDLVPEPAKQVEAATGGRPGGRQSTGRRQVTGGQHFWETRFWGHFWETHIWMIHFWETHFWKTLLEQKN